MKTSCEINCLQNLQWHSEQIPFFILLLRVLRFTYSLNSLGINPQNSGQKNDKDSVPWYTEVTFLLSKKLLFQKLYVDFLCTNTSYIVFGDIEHFCC